MTRLQILLGFVFLTVLSNVSARDSTFMPEFNTIEATVFVEGNKFMSLRGSLYYNSVKEFIAAMSMKMIDAKEKMPTIYFDWKGLIYFWTEEGYIKTEFDGVLFPLVPLLSAAHNFKSDVDVNLGIDPLPKKWPILNWVNDYTTAHFEGQDEYVSKSELVVNGNIYTKFTSVQEDCRDCYITFDEYGRLTEIMSEDGFILYEYVNSNEKVVIPNARYEPTLGSFLVNMIEKMMRYPTE